MKKFRKKKGIILTSHEHEVDNLKETMHVVDMNVLASKV